MNSSMPTLYVRTGCPYCAMVLRALEQDGIELTLKNIAEPGVEAELVEKGGKRQVPYLVDEAHGVAMYESDDIIDYLHRTYTDRAV